jgi:site-specific DNA-adenine methylase
MDGSHATVEQLRPFFGFYGGKWRDALKNYPAPTHDTIIEPFAGSAGYALRYWQRQVILCELDPVLASMWQYLIRVTPQEILRIPDLGDDETVDDLKICQEAKWLVGFWLNRGVSTPRRSPSKWMRIRIRPGSFWGERVRNTIASQVTAIRHWQVFNCSYVNAPAPEAATWFIDPPYQRAGAHYRFGSEEIDFAHLSAWCQERRGQVMVCENEGADWLPFQPLAAVKTTRSKKSKEAIWTNQAPVDAEDSSADQPRASRCA